MTAFDIPSNWTPKQVDACLDLLHALYEAIWEQYEDMMTTHYLLQGVEGGKSKDLPEPPHYLDPHSYETEDDIPF